MLLSSADWVSLALGNLSCPPSRGPTEVKRAEAASPPGPPVTREALTGQVSYLCRPPSPRNDYLTRPGTLQAPAVVSDLELFIVSGN